MLNALYPHRGLYWQLLKRDIASKYRGSALGILWSVLNPLLMLCVYTFVFSVVFSARWLASGEQPKAEFALILFAGLMIHTLAAETLLRAPQMITSQVNYVKKVVFPLQVMPLVPLGSALFNYGISLAILLSVQIFVKGSLPLSTLLVPLIILPYVIALAGAAWILASLGVYLRDITQVVGLLVSMLMFLSPIFFPVEALPEAWRGVMYANPLTLIITEARKVLLWNETPNWMALLQYLAAASVFAIAGFYWFQKTRKGFADVL